VSEVPKFDGLLLAVCCCSNHAAVAMPHPNYFSVPPFLSILLVFSLSSCSSVDIDRVLADTSQYCFMDDASHLDFTFKRHHLVCFHREETQKPYASTVDEGREKCCDDLHRSGLIRPDSKKYCFDHIALVPDVSTFAGGKQRGDYTGRVSPSFYLAKDEDVVINSETITLTGSYHQIWQLKVHEDAERATFRDGFNVVQALSPFHLAGFVSDGGGTAGESKGAGVFPSEGKAVGAISPSGGHHRPFHQKIYLSLDTLSAASDKKYQMNINATTLLPIMEDIFIDADDPLLVEYASGSLKGVYCGVSIDNEMVKIFSSTCDIRFVHSETIDIEQPSFASRQYIVAYEVKAMLDVSFGQNSVDFMKELEVVVSYGTTLHLRYPPPITNENNQAINGLVPVTIQHPVLYAASMSLEDKYENTNTYYAFQPDAILNSPHPIIVRAAAGLDSDYWWTTVITMVSALVGGLVLINSFDAVSTWC